MSAPAWHPDPGSYHHVRWWDGSQWTEHTHEAPHEMVMQRMAMAQLAMDQDREVRSAYRWWFWGFVALFVVAVVIAVVVGNAATT